VLAALYVGAFGAGAVLFARRVLARRRVDLLERIGVALWGALLLAPAGAMFLYVPWHTEHGLLLKPRLVESPTTAFFGSLAALLAVLLIAAFAYRARKPAQADPAARG
jgi:hypothetical protein